MPHQAACSCGQLRATCEGEPVRVSMCHCLACQRRTGSAFGLQARWPRGLVLVEGEARVWVRIADSGNGVTFHFCPLCGSTVYYWLNEMPEIVAIAVGAFADAEFPAPRFSVYETRRHKWVDVPHDIEHFD